MENAPTPITVQHGGTGGTQALSFDIGGNIYIFGALIFVHPRILELSHSRRKTHCRLWFPV